MKMDASGEEGTNMVPAVQIPMPMPMMMFPSRSSSSSSLTMMDESSDSEGVRGENTNARVSPPPPPPTEHCASYGRRQVSSSSLRSLSVSPVLSPLLLTPTTGTATATASRSTSHCCVFEQAMPLADDILSVIASKYLNPKERARLALCSKRLNSLLPPQMRIRITTTTTTATTSRSNEVDDGSANDAVVADAAAAAAVEGIANDLFVCLASMESVKMKTKDHKKKGKAKELISPVPGVAVVENDDDDDDENDRRKHESDEIIGQDRFLLDSDNLYYGRRYFLCSYDYEREQRVYLGRHTRHGMNNSNNTNNATNAAANTNNNDQANEETQQQQQPSHCYSIGFHPDQRKTKNSSSCSAMTDNQTWEIVGGTDGDVVILGDDDVSLVVGGSNPRQGLPDSQQRSLLSCRGTPTPLPPLTPSPSRSPVMALPNFFSPFSSATSTGNANHGNIRRRCGTPTWCAIPMPVRDGLDQPVPGVSQTDRLRIVPSRSYVPPPSLQLEDDQQNAYSSNNFDDVIMTSSEEFSQSDSDFHSDSQRRPTVNHESYLSIYGIPEACDEGEYLLYSPDSSAQGQVGCDGSHVVVDFEYWVRGGIMHFRCPVLPFTLGIPILDTDSTDMVDDNNSQNQSSSCREEIQPMTKLLDLRSARWGSLIYYVAVAADVSEGKALDMNRFLNRVTDHEEHTVRVNEKKNLVRIEVRDKKIMKIPDVKKTGGWKFLLSW
eukprot:CAMPEP_0113497758 /NCGR_PEP_ID=MMETSP0014_2-20120614/30796_1 /TAXON_ID=2857 /ORGANISM="Nitzschia sp." /LENGTH=719 /DNA_ID=CAMNT_0000391709 /DNA_START=134 /DNA_END=2293 /DNA_ORIENTATION=- /assembly_acc=CAM_ASM_000159